MHPKSIMFNQRNHNPRLSTNSNIDKRVNQALNDGLLAKFCSLGCGSAETDII